MRRILIAAIAMVAAGCAAMPTVAPKGDFAPDAEFTLVLPETWSYWPPNQNLATVGGYLSRDGMLLNRVHLMTLKDGERILKFKGKDGETPSWSSTATEYEIVELVTSSLLKIGYNTMEADNVRPATVDGTDGIAFDLSGKWKNGLNVKGDVLAVKKNDKLNLVFFLAPELHYYGDVKDEVELIMASIDLK